ncbi:hypothetical protein [Garciella nitratireducens]|uniref:hypothetical protein n=1 Tax=Garciella nitratireducens TaxID=218205 RepID=UPI0024B58968|nr:hypothetical protein [Garciella nitratireducens]
MSKNLKQEISNLLVAVEKYYAKDSITYQNLDYYFDICSTVFKYSYDSDKDLLIELKKLLLKLSKEIPELNSEQYKENHSKINEMIEYLDENLTD